MTYSWIQVGNTAGISIANANQKVASFIAPSRISTLDFRFTARDSKGAEASEDVRVQIVQATGGGGGNGGGGNDGGADGTTDCSQDGNAPAVADVPARVEAISGERVSILASNGRDPDNTIVFVNGVLASGITYRWEVIAGAGILSTPNLQDASTERVSFDTPRLSEETALELRLTVNDSKGCGTKYPIEVILEASTDPNQAPVALLTYTIESEGNSPAGGSEESVQSPAVILLDASGSTDEGELNFTFSVDEDLEAGEAGLEKVSDSMQKLIIAEGTSGRVIARVTVTDDGGLWSTAELSFAIEAFDSAPDAVVRYRLDGEDTFQTAGEEPITISSPGSILIDASESIDDGEFSVAFLVQQSLLTSSVELESAGDKARKLKIALGTQGTVRVVVTVIDDKGQTDVVELLIQIEDSRSMPVAKLTVFVGGQQWSQGTGVRQGAIVTLDASSSHLENGDVAEGMIFIWKQASGDPVNLMFSEDGRIARFRAPELDEDLLRLRFELLIEYQGIQKLE